MTPTTRFRLRLERLEARDVPAPIFNPATFTYTDVDGDHVTIKASSGDLRGATYSFGAMVVGRQLLTINLKGINSDGVNLNVTVAKVPGGDGLANVGYIDATGVDLGRVTIKGDLGQIDAGDADTTTPGLKALSVRSLGRLGSDTQSAIGGGGNLESNINGALGALVVAGDVKDAFVDVTGGADGKIGAITIGGSLIGGSFNYSGLIFSEGDIGRVKIGHDVQGGTGERSGLIESRGKLASATVGGSLLGGSHSGSGQIFSAGDMGAVRIGHDVLGNSGAGSGFIYTDGKLAGVSIGGSLIGGSGESGQIHSGLDMGVVKIGHDVQGGLGASSGHIRSGGNLAGVSIGGSLLGGSGGSSGQIWSPAGDMGAVRVGHNVQGGSGVNSGYILSNGKIAGVSIGGSLIGGSGNLSGKIFSRGGDMGAVTIGHDFTGGSITGAASLDGSGVIESAGRISSVTIGGSIISGIDASSGTLHRNATILAGNDIGSLTVRGSVIGHGNTPNSGASPVVISARGQAVQGATTDLAIGKIRIGGRVEFANILAGYDTNLIAVNGDAQIGAVSVGGDWAASNLVAGAMNTASGNTKFGDGNDTSIGAGTAGIIAKIASITIGGQVYGTPASVNNTDNYGFVAEQVVSVRIGGIADALSSGPHNNAHGIGPTADMAVFEV